MQPIYNNSSWPCILLELAQGGDVSMWQVYDVERALQLRMLRYAFPPQPGPGGGGRGGLWRQSNATGSGTI